MINCTQDGSKMHITFKDAMTIYSAKESYDSLAKINWKRSVTDIDLSGVDAIDSSGIQLLLMIAKSTAEHNCTLNIRHSAPSQEIFDLLNLNSLFEHSLAVK